MDTITGTEAAIITEIINKDKLIIVNQKWIGKIICHAERSSRRICNHKWSEDFADAF